MAITPEQVDAVIESVYYFTASEGVHGRWNMEPPLLSQELVRLECMTFCVIMLKNGYMVYGVSSCVVTEENNPDLGRDAAYTDAIGKVYGLLGFVQRDVITGAQYLVPPAAASTGEGV